MQWNDLIEKMMIDNEGSASLSYLYENASKYKELPSGDWQKTLRGVLYRDEKKGRFKKIGLGVFALSNFISQDSAYDAAIHNRSYESYFKSVKDLHSVIEGMLIELGSFFEFRTYTSDINKSFDNKKLRDLIDFSPMPEFTYKEITEIISKSDVIWFSRNKLAFPKYIFEVEASTDFTNSMHKMYQLIDFDSRFYLIAPQSRKQIFLNRVEREPFNSSKTKFTFRSFEDVAGLYFKSVEQNELKTKFMEK
jgi:mannose-6-phosphate isomerase class I